MFFSHTPKNRMRYVLVFGITALVIVSPATETPASQKDDSREHPPKLLNYSKMTTQQLVNEGEEIIFGGLGLAKLQGAVGKGQCTLCHATHP